MAERRGNVIQIRVSDGEKERVEANAKACDKTVSEWLRWIALEPDATKPQIIHASGDASEALRNLEDPEKVTEALQAEMDTIKAQRTVQRPYRCPDNRCSFQAGSEAALCPLHARRVVAVK